MESMGLPTCYGIIPARWGSTRFPGKPLADILGRPMFWHVFKRASQCAELKRVYLATDDPRIAKAAGKLDVPTVLTRADHPSGTDRVLEAAVNLQLEPRAVVVNIQGDEPALQPAMLSELVAPFRHPGIRVTTLVQKIDAAEAQHPDRVKVVFAGDGRALYFSRARIPYHHAADAGPYYGHVGLYAFRMESLRQFVACGQSRLEATEKLEQLRLLENNIPIHVVTTHYRSSAVDRPEDIRTVSKIMLREKTK